MEWPANQPSTLEEACLDFFLENIFKFLDKTDDSYCLKSGITFPQGLSDKLLWKLINQSKHLQNPDDNVFGVFSNRASTILTDLPLRYSAVTPEQLDYLCLHPVREIDITYCQSIKSKYVDAINQSARSLRSLRLGGSDQFERLDFLLSDIFDNDAEENELQLNEKGDSAKVKNGNANQTDAIFNLPNLRSLSLRDIKSFRPMDGVQMNTVPLLDRLIRPLKSLTHLDLCECQLEKTTLTRIGDLNLPNLVSLSLSDVLNGCDGALCNLCKLTNLRHLDISQGDDTSNFLPVQYPNPDDRLRNLITCMPHLRSLDISGTNLAGLEPQRLPSHKPGPKQCDEEPKTENSLPGSDGRQFEFLGLLNCSDDASHRKNIPAKKVTGDANEDQVLLSVHVYRDKPFLLTRAFNTLFNKFRFDTVKAHCSALEGLLTGMSRNKHDKHVQISGSASLFYIVKGKQKHQIAHNQKRKIISCLLDAMERHMTEHTMMRNGCLTLCHFNIPYEVLYCYNRLVNILLLMLRGDFNDDFLQRLGIFLLNSLACQVDGEQKQSLGDMGTVEVMCRIIRQKLDLKVCDEILEVCWSTLWNVTDETERNCERFMDERGMFLFLNCFKIFPEKEELLRNMMGLMGNIAEVTKLRCDLMNDEYVTVFTNFLESTKDGIEVSYNAAGVLAHMLSDGDDHWTVTTLDRSTVVRRLVDAIKRWPLDSKRNINYRSFGPILRLVRCYKSHASQYWAIWALCNLTQVYPEKYCQLLKDEGGLENLEMVTRDPRPIDAIKNLAVQVINLVTNRQALPHPDSVEEGEALEIQGEELAIHNDVGGEQNGMEN